MIDWQVLPFLAFMAICLYGVALMLNDRR